MSRLLPSALAVDVPHALPIMAGLDPNISIGMVADWDCIVRKLVWVADGRVKPDHDEVRTAMME